MAGKMMVVHHKASRKATVVPTEDKRILKAAAYCRVSTMMDEQESSFETQRDYYTKLIDSRNGMENVGIYADRGFSGLRADSRPELQRLLRDCRNGKVDVVFVKSVSRLSRNLRAYKKAQKALKQEEEQYFAPGEVDSMLPEHLRRNPHSQNR